MYMVIVIHVVILSDYRNPLLYEIRIGYPLFLVPFVKGVYGFPISLWLLHMAIVEWVIGFAQHRRCWAF